MVCADHDYKPWLAKRIRPPIALGRGLFPKAPLWGAPKGAKV